MADIPDIYMRVRAVEDELADWLDAHDSEAGGSCDCPEKRFIQRLHGMVEQTLDLMDPEMAGQWRGPAKA